MISQPRIRAYKPVDGSTIYERPSNIYIRSFGENPKTWALKQCQNTAETFVVKETTSPGYFFPGIPLNLMQNILAFKVSIYIQSCPYH